MVYEVRMQSLADLEGKIASAKEKGIDKASKANALNMLTKDIDTAVIAEATGLAQSVIHELMMIKKVNCHQFIFCSHE